MDSPDLFILVQIYQHRDHHFSHLSHYWFSHQLQSKMSQPQWNFGSSQRKLECTISSHFGGRLARRLTKNVHTKLVEEGIDHIFILTRKTTLVFWREKQKWGKKTVRFYSFFTNNWSLIKLTQILTPCSKQRSSTSKSGLWWDLIGPGVIPQPMKKKLPGRWFK